MEILQARREWQAILKVMKERFNKDLEEIKKSQSIMNNAIHEIKTLWREATVE